MKTPTIIGFIPKPKKETKKDKNKEETTNKEE